MKSKPRTFKETTIFDWDSEPAEERPSEFAHSALSGYAPLRPRQPKVTKAIGKVFFACVATLSLGGAALFGMIHLLRA